LKEDAMDEAQRAFLKARLDEAEAVAKEASGGTVVGEPGNWKPAPGGDEWEVNADLVDGDYGRDGDLEVLVALRRGLPRPPDVRGGYWGSVVSWHRDLADRDAWVPEAQFRHMALHDPASVLAEVWVWRNLLLKYAIPPGTDAVYGGTERETGYRLALAGALSAKLATYAAHPEYQPGWPLLPPP
jgi:hypothetical protein